MTNLLQTSNAYPLINALISLVIKTTVPFEVKVFSSQNLLGKDELVIILRQELQVSTTVPHKNKIIIPETIWKINIYFIPGNEHQEFSAESHQTSKTIKEGMAEIKDYTRNIRRWMICLRDAGFDMKYSNTFIAFQLQNNLAETR